MMGRAGPLQDARAATLLLSGLSLSFPVAPLPLLLKQVVIAWASRRGMRVLEGGAQGLADALHVALIEEGWCLDEFQNGEVCALAISDAEMLCALAVNAPLASSLIQS